MSRPQLVDLFSGAGGAAVGYYRAGFDVTGWGGKGLRQHYSREVAGVAMGIDWMTLAELSQAIPPAYTEWLGRQLIEIVRH